VVSFTLPGKVTLAAESGLGDESVISFASAVAEEINGGRPALRYAADDAPFYGAGVREGVSVGLPNVGGQWVTSFDRAQIEIQIVGRSSESVRQSQAELLQRVTDVARTLQEDAGIPASEQISTTVAPLTTEVDHVTSSRSSQLAAFGSLGVAAMIVAAWLSVVADRLHVISSRRTPTNKRGLLRGVMT
jgi:hypothetical protein